jgi:ATP-dependent Clp protease ATP-binding subunit ClpA
MQNTIQTQPETLSKLQLLEAHLRERIRGQNHVLPRIVSVLQRGELGITKPERPKGSFLLLGPREWAKPK